MSENNKSALARGASGETRPQVLITISGPDRPGITSGLTEILAQDQSTILDIGQSVIHGQLALTILIELPSKEASEKAILKDLLFKAKELGVKLDFEVYLEDSKEGNSSRNRLSSPEYRYALTLIGKQVSARALHEVTSSLARFALNIDTIQRLSEGRFSCVEFLVSSTQELNQHQMKKELLQIARNQGVDIALQTEGLFRRTKRLVVMDMDSTLIQNEVIDEIARHMGVYDEVCAITESAMQGKLDFDESLRKRCEKLAGFLEKDVDHVFSKIQLTNGAQELIKVLKKLGYKVALISGGFTCIAEKLKSRLGIDFAYANYMEFKDGRFTGSIRPPIVNAQRKADLLDVIAQQEQITLDQVIAIGDGANDLLMLEKAGLGIAFNAKPVVSEQADLSLSQAHLGSIFYLLGMSARDVEAVLMRN